MFWIVGGLVWNFETRLCCLLSCQGINQTSARHLWHFGESLIPGSLATNSLYCTEVQYYEMCQMVDPTSRTVRGTGNMRKRKVPMNWSGDSSDNIISICQLRRHCKTRFAIFLK